MTADQRFPRPKAGIGLGVLNVAECRKRAPRNIPQAPQGDGGIIPMYFTVTKSEWKKAEPLKNDGE